MTTQLIINGEPLPHVDDDKYQCYEEELAVQRTMSNGRLTKELTGVSWHIVYEYDTMPQEQYRRVLAALRSSGPLRVQFLPDNSSTLAPPTDFLCTVRPQPAFAFDDNGGPVWHNVRFELQEVDPHA